MADRPRREDAHGQERLYEDDVLVIGLGRFGGAVAIELQRLGHHVVAVERDPYLAESFSRQGDPHRPGRRRLPQTVANLRARSFQLAVVGIGSSVEASVLTR